MPATTFFHQPRKRKMTKPKDVTLTIGFDADQISDQLAYEFTSADGSHPVHPTGLFKGEIYFEEGEIFHLQVRGGGKPDSFTAFDVIDCAIITKPQIISAGPKQPTVYAVPSPFANVSGACYPLAIDFETTATVTTVNDNGGYHLIDQAWQHTLDICHTQGRWEISLVLTVRITRGPGEESEVRVFSFDPEGQVGPPGGD